MKIPLIYTYYQVKLTQKASPNGVLSHDNAVYILSKYNVPKKLRPLILKDLQRFKLIKLIDPCKDIQVLPILEVEALDMSIVGKRKHIVERVLEMY